MPLIRRLVVASPVVVCLRLASPFVAQPPHASRRWRLPVHPVRPQSQPPPTHLWDFPVNNKYKIELIYYLAPAARDLLPTMATLLLPPLALSAMSAAAASAARARAVATESHDGGARRNLGLSRPRRLLSASASPPICLSFTGWLSRCQLSRASALRHRSSRSCLTRPDDGDCPFIRCVHGRNHPQCTCGISRRVHCHHRCNRKNYHLNNKYKMELIYYPALAARDALPTMATPLLPPSASSAMSAAAASAARAGAVAAKSRDGGARRNLGLSRPRRLLSAGTSPPVCLSFAGWLSHCLLSRASASRHLLSRSRLTRPDNGDRPSRRRHHCRLRRPLRHRNRR